MTCRLWLPRKIDFLDSKRLSDTMTTRDKWYQLLGSMALLVPLLPMLLTFTAGAYAQQSDSSESLDTWPMTVAEASGFTATANEAQVNSFLGQLVQTWPAAQLVEIGRSVEQRPIWAVVVQPQVRQDERPLTAMVLGGIHSGECDGKEAILALLRDFAAGQYAKDWRSLRMIFVPNF
ncbi:MAG: hypothetical protein KDA51_04585, partial [Planctomycetales bacterium]|nr:hypothetical protein [Planctomycetales bacterium]